jgi:hypothetical protein
MCIKDPYICFGKQVILRRFITKEYKNITSSNTIKRSNTKIQKHTKATTIVYGLEGISRTGPILKFKLQRH